MCASFTNSYKAQLQCLQLQLHEATTEIHTFEKVNADLSSSIAGLELECQAKVGAALLDQDRAHFDKEQLFQLKVALSKLKVDVAHLEEKVARKNQDCERLNEEESGSETQREELRTSLTTMEAQLIDCKKIACTNKDKLKAASEISGGKLRALGISTRHNQQLKSVLKAVERFCVRA